MTLSSFELRVLEAAETSFLVLSFITGFLIVLAIVVIALFYVRWKTGRTEEEEADRDETGRRRRNLRLPLAFLMFGHTAGRIGIKQLVASLLLLTLILVEVAANSAYASGVNTSTVAVSPGKYDLTLGNDFPTFGTVKLSYPDSAILTNSTGDLLFNVTLNPLMLNPTSAQVGHSVSES